jgi:hypothetical protein
MNVREHLKWLFIAVFGLSASLGTSLGLVACGDDDDSTNTGDDDDDDTGGATGITGEPTDSVSKSITAATGGTVALGTKASVNIPAGALGTDVDVSVKEYPKAGQPDAANLGSNVFDFGPDGTKFNRPVTLTLEFKGTVPEGKKATIAFLKSDKWEVLADSKVADGKVVASTDHFTPFVIFFDLATGGQTEGTCGGDFTACGGNVVGKWTYSAACLTIDPSKLPTGGCPGSGFGFELDVVGTVEFTADGKFTVDSVNKQTQIQKQPKSCLPGGGLASCEDVFKPKPEEGKTTEEIDGVCYVREVKADQKIDTTGTYTTSGNNLTFTGEEQQGGGSKTAVITYCVDGNKMTIRQENDGTVVVYDVTKN